MNAFSYVRVALSLSLTIGFLAGSSLAQSPSISGTSPQAIRPGESLDVKLKGGSLAGATELWSSFPCTAVLSPDVKDNGTNAAEVVYRLSVPSEAYVGVHAIRVTTPKGTSALRLFCVDDLPSVAQQANNTSPATAQELKLPVAVDGSVASLGRNYYKFHADAGQRISFEVLARRLGSPLDPMIRILDAGGRELTYSDDEAGLSGDSQLSHTFGTAGDYVLELRDISYRGGGNFNYRLRIGDFPCVSVPYPMGAKRGEQTTIAFAGLDVVDFEPVTLTAPSDPLIHWITVGGKRAGGQSSGFATLAVTDRDEFVETEPNNEADKSNRVTLGANVNGRFDEPGDVDRFVFSAKKGQAMEFASLTRRQGSPCDLVLRLLKSDGAQVSEVDDSGATDGFIRYTFPDDGDYTLVAAERSQRFGSQFAYRVVVTENKPGFALAASADTLNVPAGGTAMVTVTSVRNGYNGPIDVSIAGLPKGLASVPTIIGPGQNSVVLTVTAQADVPPGKAQPVRVVGTAKVGDGEFQATASVAAALKGQLNATPFPPRILEAASVLGITPKPAFAVRAEPAELIFGKNLNATAKLIVDRPEGIDEAISLAVTPEKNGLPAGITAAVKAIGKGANEVQIVFSANDKAPLGAFTGVLVATHKKEKTTTTSVVPGLKIVLKAPMQIVLDIGVGKLKAGTQLKVKAVVERNPALAGEIVIAFQKLPKGVTAAEAKIAADANEVEILLTAAQDAQVGSVADVTITAQTTVGKAKFSATSAKVALAVEAP